MQRIFTLLIFLISVNLIFAEKPIKNYVEKVSQTATSEEFRGYCLATAGNSTTRVEFRGGTTIYIPQNTRILELYITRPTFSSWNWSVNPSGLFQGLFPGDWGGILMSSSGMDGVNIVSTGTLVSGGTLTKVLVLREE